MARLTGSAGRDGNRQAVTFGVASADGVTVKPLELDSSNNLLTSGLIRDTSGHAVTVTNNKLDVNATVTGGSGGSSATDESGFTAGVTVGTIAMGFYHSTIDTVSDGQTAALAMDSKRNLFSVIRDAAGNARGVNVTAGNALTVDGSAATQPVSYGSGTFVVAGGKTNNNAAPGATNVGTLPAIANAAAPSWSEGNQVALSTDLSGNLRITGSLSVGGTTDNSAFTAGTSTGTPAMGFYHSTIDTVTDGRTATLGMTNKREMFVNLRSAGSEVGTSGAPLQVSIANTGANATAVKVDGSAVTQPVSVAATLSENLAQINAHTVLETVHGTNTAGNGGLSVGLMGEFDDVTPTSISENQFGNIRMSANRNVYSTIRDAAGNERGVNVTSSNELLVNVNNTPAVTVSGVATAANQTNATQKTQVVDGSGNVVTTNSTTYTSKFGLDSNLLGTLGTAFSTAGKVDVKGADGDVFVRQATATNLKTQAENYQGGSAVAAGNPLQVTLANTGANTNKLLVTADPITFASAQAVTQSGNWTTRIVGNAGATLDAVVGAGTAPTNMQAVGGIYSTTAPAPTNGQSMAIQLDQAGNLREFPGIAINTLTTISAANSNDTSGSAQNIFTNSGTPCVVVQLTPTGTISAGAITFEASYDGSTWNAVSADAVIDPTSSSNAQIAIPFAPSSGTNKYFLISTKGEQALRIKVSTTFTGAGHSVAIAYALLPYDPVTSVLAYSPTAANFKTSSNNNDGAGNALTSNSTTYSGKFGLDVNVLGTLGTAFSTAGKVDTKAADGDVFVRSNAASTFPVNANQSGTWTVQPGNTQNTTSWLVKPLITTISTTITRPADTNAYSAGDAFANSTSAPTAGGFTLTGAAPASGGTGVITDAIISSSAKTNYNGELWIFDQATTAINDNAVFDVSTSNVQNLVAIIPFQTSDTNNTTAISYVTGLNVPFTCVGTANLRFLVKLMAAVTPASAEVLAVRVKVEN